MCASGRFNLIKFMSNSREVLEKIPQEERSKDVKDFDNMTQSLPIERALDVGQCVQKIFFQDTIEGQFFDIKIYIGIHWFSL